MISVAASYLLRDTDPVIDIRLASEEDYGPLFTLQRAAFVDEARIYGTPFVPSLDETFDEFTVRLGVSTSWVAQLERRIVGAVSLRRYREGGPDVERLMVAPDCRGMGIASSLLSTLERYAASSGETHLQLIVGDLADDNRSIYRHLGWVSQHSHQLEGREHVLLHSLRKTL